MQPHAFSEQPALSVTGEIPSPVFLQEPSVTYARMMALAAMAQSLDPSLGQSLRFIQRAPSDVPNRLDVPFQILFTTDDRTSVPHGALNDPAPVPFWEGIARVLPAAVLADEQARFAAMPRLRCPTAEDAAIRTAFQENRLTFQSDTTADGVRITTSQPVRPEPTAFLNSADLTRRVLTTPLPPEAKPAAEDTVPAGGLASVARLRRSVQSLKAILSKPFENSSIGDRRAVQELITTINTRGRRAVSHESSFEVTQSHGWVAYALSKKASGWVPFLLSRAGCSPHAPYGTVPPLAVAIATGDAASVRALMDAGCSPNTAFKGWPKVYEGKHQSRLEQNDTTFVFPLVMAAALGTTPVAGALLLGGADANASMGREGTTPLMLAAQSGNEALVRVLLHHGANPTKENALGHLPSEMVPTGPSNDALFGLLESARNEASLKAGAVGPRIPSPTAGGDGLEVDGALIPSIWAEPDSPSRPRQRG